MSSLQREFSVSTRLLRRTCAVAAGAVLFWFAACNSDAHGVDTCRTVESARCEKLATCSGALRASTRDSCTAFYQVQCGNGLQDGARDPSAPELTACLAAIKGSCDIASNPYTAPECTVFLGNPVADAATDATPDGVAEVGPEAAPADASPAEAPPPDVAASETPADTTSTDAPGADAHD